ncbi:MAG: ATP-dependent DNA ligase [Anaerolineae bacterium]|nr:ATP-dependent DNA ligase [Anaerolineae bacterium]
MTETPFLALALLGERLEKTKKRLELAALIADFLKGLTPEEIGPGVRLLIGQVFPEWDSRALNLSWRAVSNILQGLTAPKKSDLAAIQAEAVDGGEWARLLLERARIEPLEPPPLPLLEVYRTFEEIAETAGPGSRRKREELLNSLFLRAQSVEAKYIVKNVVGEMRHGVSEGILLDSIAQAAEIPKKLTHRANMLCGDLGEVASIALTEGEGGLNRIKPQLFRPLKPMLAQMAYDVAQAFQEHKGKTALEYKLDGARVQIHKTGEEVRIYSRNLSEVTPSLPEVVDQVRDEVKADSAILEGEAIAVDGMGRPLPFQHLMRRFRRIHNLREVMREVPIQLYLFDILYRDGTSLVDDPNHKRWQALQEVKGKIISVARLVPRTTQDGEAFAQASYEAGHEGLIAKRLDSVYTPGIRGKAWFKIKQAISLDLVIIAADWGYGRRHGWLSNYHLAARDEDSGEFLEVGKTFKGLTDKEFEERTARLLSLEIHRQGATVYVEPNTVVEVLFNEIQRSPHYDSGLALRFARISRLRDDKSPEEADTIQTMREIFRRQFEHKGKPTSRTL